MYSYSCYLRPEDTSICNARSIDTLYMYNFVFRERNVKLTKDTLNADGYVVRNRRPPFHHTSQVAGIKKDLTGEK